MSSVKEIISGFLSPYKTTANEKQKPSTPGTPSGISNSSVNNKVVGPLNFSKQGGKRKSLKRKNKKTYKAKRR